MLTLLKIRNLALVEDLVWELGRGLVGVTGETGAGKSIIVGALKLILGERADKSLIRNGADTCTVEAVFDLGQTESVDVLLENFGLEPLKGESLIIRRVVGASTNKQFVNGSPVTSALLKDIGEYLVDLHGPHDHQSLHSKERQLEMLDAFAGLNGLRGEYEQAFRSWRKVQQEWEDLQHAERATEQEIDMLRFQIQEIVSAKLQPGEEEQVTAKHRVAANRARLTELVQGLSERLLGQEDSVLQMIRDMGRLIQELQKLDPSVESTFEGFRSAQLELQDLEGALQDYQEDLEEDGEDLGALDARLYVFQTLKRKYGGSVEEILTFQEEAEERLQKMENRGELLLELEREATRLREKVDERGETLSMQRKAAAPKLETEISKHLLDLGFKKSLFEVQLNKNAEPSSRGFEESDFHFAPNPGEPLKPLRLTASSGEMSRVLLAVKCALAKQEGIPLMVFDEIDANVGGNIAEAVGRKMAELAVNHQIIAISHMPQLASLATRHFMVRKDTEAGHTRSTILELENEARLVELARMLGGRFESAKQHAESLLDQAQSMRQSA